MFNEYILPPPPTITTWKTMNFILSTQVNLSLINLYSKSTYSGKPSVTSNGPI